MKDDISLKKLDDGKVLIKIDGHFRMNQTNKEPNLIQKFSELAYDYVRGCEAKNVDINMIVNLEGVLSMDSSGLSALVKIWKIIQTLKGKLILVNLKNEKIISLMTITHVKNIFSIMTMEEALK